MNTMGQAASLGTLKAMSHPLRWRIIAIVNATGHARATDIARQLGEPVNSVSFHLRKLADSGILAEAPELARDGRERVWKFASSSLDSDPELLNNDAAYRTAAKGSVAMVFAEVQQALVAALEARSEVAHSQATSLQLTRHQARALTIRLHQLLAEFEADPAAASAAVDTEFDEGGPSDVYTGLVALAPLARQDA